MTDAELVALAIARVGSTARLADLMWIEERNVRRYQSGEKPLSPVKRAKLEALVDGAPDGCTGQYDCQCYADQSSSVSDGYGLDGGGMNGGGTDGEAGGSGSGGANVSV